MPYTNREERRRYNQQRYQADKEAHKARSVASRRRRNAEMLAMIREAKDRPCADCAARYPYYVMQFDHLRDKEFSVSDASYAAVTIAVMQAEIAKCEVVCANCHAERTFQRRQLGTPIERLEVEPDDSGGLMLF